MNNGRRHSQVLKGKAISLRSDGLTHREIAEKLKIGLGTAFLWTQGIHLSTEQKKMIIERRYKSTFTQERRQELGRLARINLARFWKKPYSKKELIYKIRRFYLKHKRIPLKREFNMHTEYKQHFGSWNNAIRLAGFNPNPIIFSKKFVADDGHICDSFAERIIDDWLFRHRVSHNRNVPYLHSKMTADFAVGKTRIEYFGLAGEIEVYDQSIYKKRILCQQQGLKLIEIYPKDLFLKDYRYCLRKLIKSII